MPNGKPLLNRTKSFHKLFEQVEDFDGVVKEYTIDGYVIGGYCMRTICQRRILKSLAVKPSPRVMKAIAASMLQIEGDRIDFAVKHHGNGTASVLATYNKILGARLLATVGSGSVCKTPKPRKKKCKT